MYQPSKPYKHNVLKLIESTWKTPFLKVKPGLYPTFTLTSSLTQVDHTDGIGTKGIYHWKKRTFKEAVIDSLAMNLNDLAMVGATPFKLQNHIVLPKDDTKAILEIVKTLTSECKKRKIAMTGGETSIHENENAMDISITVSGFIKRTFTNKLKTGDILIGLPSSGIHSNGITKIREVFKDEIRPEFTTPTVIYLDSILKLINKLEIHGMMHITGGAFTKLKDIMSSNQNINIRRNHKLKPHKIFYELRKRGVSDKEMYTTFNCGIGFVLSVGKKDVPKVLREIPSADFIGEVTRGTGKIQIESMFNNATLSL